MTEPRVIFLDTSVYIIGTADLDSAEAKILSWAEDTGPSIAEIEVVVADELFDQILRVSRRLQNKDWGGEILARIWHNFKLRYVLVDSDEWHALALEKVIPIEEVGIYLTARNGNADHFITSNHELARDLSLKTGEFVCMTPEDFCTLNFSG